MWQFAGPRFPCFTKEKKVSQIMSTFLASSIRVNGMVLARNRTRAVAKASIVRTGAMAMALATSTITAARPMTMAMNRIISQSPRNGNPLYNQQRFASKKTDKPKVSGWDKSLKKPSKRMGKYYKMKTHKGAAQRWQVVGPSSAVGLKRAKCGQSHLRRKNRGWKKRALRERVLANAQQRNLLKKLLPYHAKKYSRL